MKNYKFWTSIFFLKIFEVIWCPVSIQAQSANVDCSIAQPLCSTNPFTVGPVQNGFGIQEATSANSCLADGERNSSWYTFTVTQAGTLAFNINPTPPPATIFGWSVWDITQGCENKGRAIACNANGCGGGSTGLSLNPQAEPGFYNCGNVTYPLNWVNLMSGTVNDSNPAPLLAGHTYALLVSAGLPTNQGFTFTFKGTAQLGLPATAASFQLSSQCRTVTPTLTSLPIPNATYTWNWNDGTAPTTVNGFTPVSHPYDPGAAATATVSLTITTACSAVSSQQTMLLPATPNAGYTAAISSCLTATLSLANPAQPGTTYTWNWGDGTAAVIGQGPVTHQYATAGTYTTTLTASSNGCTATQQVPVTISGSAACCPAGVSQFLGTAAATTTLSGGQQFSGTWQVLGDIVLTNGQYTLTPGTTFYVSSRANKLGTPITGTIVVGAGASLVVDNATVTAAGPTTSCLMWRGIEVDNTTSPLVGAQRLTIRNGSVISHALCGVSNRTSDQNRYAPEYTIENSAFRDNLTHIRDVADYTNTSGHSLIRGCTFTSDPARMKAPYRATSAYNTYYTYQALLLTPLSSSSGPPAVQVENNSIDHAVYGIVCNQADQSHVIISGNTLREIYQTGIWLTTNFASTLAYNEVSLSAPRSRNTAQINPAATLTGILTESGAKNEFVQNTVYGDRADDPANFRPQIGLQLRYQASASGNRLIGLTQGVVTASLEGGALFDNLLLDCQQGVVVQPSPNNLFEMSLICNSFRRDGTSAYLQGLVVENGADINNLGSEAEPNGNRFEGQNESARNDGVNTGFKYFRFDSQQEDVPFVGGSTGGSVIPSFQADPTDACRNRQATTGNGVNQRRGSVGVEYMMIQALMDSVKRRVVAPATRQRYLYQVVAYHVQEQRLTDLATWWATLAGPNPEDYQTLGLYLLRSYYAANEAASITLLRAALLSYATPNPEVRYQLAYLAVLENLGSTGSLSTADSTTLRDIAASNTYETSRASQLLRYYYPRLVLPAAATRSTAATLSRKPTAARSSPTWLTAAYPTPATDLLTVRLRVALATRAAELRFYDLSGRLRLTMPVPARGEQVELTTSVRQLPTGLYSCVLVLDGQPTQPHRLSILH